MVPTFHTPNIPSPFQPPNHSNPNIPSLFAPTPLLRYTSSTMPDHPSPADDRYLLRDEFERFAERSETFESRVEAGFQNQNEKLDRLSQQISEIGNKQGRTDPRTVLSAAGVALIMIGMASGLAWTMLTSEAQARKASEEWSMRLDTVQQRHIASQIDHLTQISEMATDRVERIESRFDDRLSQMEERITP